MDRELKILGLEASVPAAPEPTPQLAELHLHLEGALSVARARELAGLLPGVTEPPGGFPADDRWDFHNLGEFLRTFGWCTRLLEVPGAYLRLLEDLSASLREQGVVYAELFVAFGQMHRIHLDPCEIIPVLAKRARELEAEGGPRLVFIADATRQWGLAAAEKVLDDALRLQQHRVIAFGMGGDERAERAKVFRGLYRRARAGGLGTTIHAGEGTTAEAVREAVEELEVPRVGHGISAIEDPRLIGELAREGIVLEVCPTSNYRTGAWSKDQGEHPLGRLVAAGVPVILGSDDPAFFDCTLSTERALVAKWGLEIESFDKCGFQAAFGPTGL